MFGLVKVIVVVLIPSGYVVISSVMIAPLLQSILVVLLVCVVLPSSATFIVSVLGCSAPQLGPASFAGATGDKPASSSIVSTASPVCWEFGVLLSDLVSTVANGGSSAGAHGLGFGKAGESSG